MCGNREMESELLSDSKGNYTIHDFMADSMADLLPKAKANTGLNYTALIRSEHFENFMYYIIILLLIFAVFAVICCMIGMCLIGVVTTESCCRAHVWCICTGCWVLKKCYPVNIMVIWSPVILF